MIDDAKTDVGDIDLVLLTDRTDQFKTNYWERLEELAKEIGGEDVLSSRRWQMNWAETFVERQLLCGPRKHPLLSFGNLRVLKDLACPCQLIFDASKGGGVDNAILSRHPDSPGKSNRIGEKRSMPDLRAARQRLRPVSGNLAARWLFHLKCGDQTGAWEEDDGRYLTARDVKQRMRIITGAELPERVRPNVVTRRLNFAGCDGRGSLAILFNDASYPDLSRPLDCVECPAFGLVIGRAITEATDRVQLKLEVQGAAQRRRSPDGSCVSAATWWLHVLVGTDVERIMRRDLEEGVERKVTIEIEDRTGQPAMLKMANSLGEEIPALLRAVHGRIHKHQR